jgi:predicted transcriptional regulator
MKTAGAILRESVQPDEKSTELFFLLASIDRKRILSQLQQENLRLNETAKRLDMTATEALRQLQRLTEGGLLEKIPDGKYRLTSYGKLVLDTSSPLDFIAKFREFFLAHDASLLPPEYRARLGELSECKLVATTTETFNNTTGMLKNARQRIDATVELGFELHLQMMMQRLHEGVKVRWLMQESFLTKAKPILRSEKEIPDLRSTPRLSGHIYVTDKAAAITLRRNDGTMSLSSFYGEDLSFLKWARDLFTFEWQKAKPWNP